MSFKYVDYCDCTESVGKLGKDGEYTCLTCHRPLNSYIPMLLPEEDEAPHLPNEAYDNLMVLGGYCYDCNTNYFGNHNCRGAW